jgi:hypothetical protein
MAKEQVQGVGFVMEVERVTQEELDLYEAELLRMDETGPLPEAQN